MSPKLLNFLLLLTPVALYLGYIDPLYSGNPGLVWTPEKSIFVLRSENAQYANALEQFTFIEEQMEKIHKDYKAVDEESRNKAKLLLPDSVDPVRLRNEVRSIADKSGVAITGLIVEPDTTKTTKDVGAYKVTFSMSARYPIMKKLIESFEKSTRLFLVDSINISKVEKKDDKASDGFASTDNEGVLNGSVTFRVYYLK